MLKENEALRKSEDEELTSDLCGGRGPGEGTVNPASLRECTRLSQDEKGVMWLMG